MSENNRIGGMPPEINPTRDYAALLRATMADFKTALESLEMFIDGMEGEPDEDQQGSIDFLESMKLLHSRDLTPAVTIGLDNPNWPMVSSGADANDADALPAAIEGAEYLTTRFPLSFRPEGVELSRSGINGLPVPEGANRYSPLTFTFYAYAEDGIHSYWNTEYSVWMSAQRDDPEAQRAINDDMEMAIRLEDSI